MKTLRESLVFQTSFILFFFNVCSVAYSFHKGLLKKKFKNTSIENSWWNSWSNDFQSHGEKLIENWAGWEHRVRWSNLLLVVSCLNALEGLHQIPIYKIKRVQGKCRAITNRDIHWRNKS